MRNYNLIKFEIRTVVLLFLLLLARPVPANIHGGGTGTGPAVALIANGSVFYRLVYH